MGALGSDIGLVGAIVGKIVIILIPLILTVAYLTYFERKVIGFMQLRVGPNVTGLDSAVCRRAQTAVQRSNPPQRIQPLSVLYRTDALARAFVCRMGGDSV